MITSLLIAFEREIEQRKNKRNSLKTRNMFLGIFIGNLKSKRLLDVLFEFPIAFFY